MFLKDDCTGRIVFDKESYKNEEEMWAAVARQLKILTENDYEVYFRAEDSNIGIYQLDFAHDPNSGEDDWGCSRFMLVTSEEEDEIFSRRDNPEPKEVNVIIEDKDKKFPTQEECTILC